jgi:pyruvate dehydrogenase E2 component (dihydrolipoamide acetyltransferase)
MEVTVPLVGEAGTEVTIAHWYKKEGDTVSPGEALFDVETDKATLTVEAFDKGVLNKILIPEKGQTKAGAVVAYIFNANESHQQSTEVVQDNPTGTAPSERQKPVQDIQSPDYTFAPNQSIRNNISPKARKIAGNNHIKIENIRGSGMGGMIVCGDLPVSTGSGVNNLRAAMAKRMVLSKSTIPHFYLMVDVDVSNLETLRKRCTEINGWQKPPSYTTLLLRAIGIALIQYPEYNMIVDADKPLHLETADVGVAIATKEGLVAPVVSEPGINKLQEISQNIHELSQRAITKQFKASDLLPHAITLSNLGMYGMDAFIGIIDPPGTMLLAAGRAVDRVVPLNGHPVIVKMMTLTLSVDHRVFDGASAASFLSGIVSILENPVDF